MSKKEESTNINIFEQKEEKIDFNYFYNQIDWVNPVPIARCFIIAYQNSNPEKREKFNNNQVEKLRESLLNLKKDISFYTDRLVAVMANLNLDLIKEMIDDYSSNNKTETNYPQATY